MTEMDPALDGAVAEDTGEGTFQARIRTAGIEFLADEPEAVGGLGTGPSPYQLLASALASCTTMTLRLYATRKGWPVERVRTMVGHRRDPSAATPDIFTRCIVVEGDLDEEQHARMIEMADRCPVHRTLEGGARIETRAGHTTPPAGDATDHAVDMEALIAVGRGSFDFTQ